MLNFETIQENILSLKKQIAERLSDYNPRPQTVIRSYETPNKEELNEYKKKFAEIFPEELELIFSKQYGYLIDYRFNLEDEPGVVISASQKTATVDFLLNGRPNWSSSDSKYKYSYTLWYEEGAQEELIPFLESSYILDDLKHSIFVLLRIGQNRENIGLYLYIYPDELYKLNLTVEEYLQKSIEYKGLHLWQAYFVDDKDFKMRSPLNNPFLYNLKKLAPESDLNEFEIKDTEIVQPRYQLIANEKDYRSRLKELVNELENQEGIKVTYSLENDYGAGVSPAAIHKIEKIIGGKLPDELLAFYSCINGFQLDWIKKINGTFISSGAFGIPSLECMFTGREGDDRSWEYQLNWDFNVLVSLGFTESDFGLFPHVSEYGDFRFCYAEDHISCIYKFDSNFNMELYVLNITNSYPLNLSFSEFLDCLFEARGVEHWPCLLIDPSLQNTEELGKLRTIIKENFPDADLDKLSPRKK